MRPLKLIPLFASAQNLAGIGPRMEILLRKALKMPPGIYKAGVQSGRLAFDVLPAAGAQRDELWDMFKVAVDTGYLPKLPGEDAIYKPQ